jgi:hypothetical protein
MHTSGVAAARFTGRKPRRLAFRHVESVTTHYQKLSAWKERKPLQEAPLDADRDICRKTCRSTLHARGRQAAKAPASRLGDRRRLLQFALAARHPTDSARKRTCGSHEPNEGINQNENRCYDCRRDCRRRLDPNRDCRRLRLRKLVRQRLRRVRWLRPDVQTRMHDQENHEDVLRRQVRREVPSLPFEARLQAL